MRIMGLDVGERRIGVAISDPGGVLASPLEAIEREGEDRDVKRVLELMQKHDVGCVVVGIPFSMSGTMGQQAKRADTFRRALTRVSKVQVVGWDERLSTVEAERRLRQVGVDHSFDRGRTDAASAAIILQSYLDSQRRKK
jgi:putative Holliday junction resolvase